jgi:hypothetical protein
MLSNTADTNPSPSVVSHDAIGSRSTGISDAASTRQSRKTAPRRVAGMTDQSGRRQAAVASSTTQTVEPRNGNRSPAPGNRTLVATLTAMAEARISATMAIRPQSNATCPVERASIGWYLCCCSDAGMPQTTSATPAATYACTTSSGLTPSIHIIVVVVSPTTLPEPPAFEAATMAAM